MWPKASQGLPGQFPLQGPDPAEDAVQVPLHLHQRPGVVQEVLTLLLQAGTGQVVEIQHHLIGLLKVVQHVLLGQHDGIDVIPVHHAQDSAAEDPRGRVQGIHLFFLLHGLHIWQPCSCFRDGGALPSLNLIH